jgi:hypothetical protein
LTGGLLKFLMFHWDEFLGSDVPFIEKPEEKPKTKFTTWFEKYQKKTTKDGKL